MYLSASTGKMAKPRSPIASIEKWSLLNEESVNSVHWFWHVSFFYLRDVPEMLIQGREEIFWSTWMKNETFDPSSISEEAVPSGFVARQDLAASEAFSKSTELILKMPNRRFNGRKRSSPYRFLRSAVSISWEKSHCGRRNKSHTMRSMWKSRVAGIACHSSNQKSLLKRC
jgi:hypothetical protein